MLKDFDTSSDNNGTDQLTAFGNLLAFEGWSSIMGSGLWTTTAGGDIYELTNFDMNSKSNQINDIIVVNNELFISTNLANSIGVSLWQSEE